MRCHKHDEDGMGCIAEAGHKGRCAIRLNPDDPQPETWPCAVEGCDRRVKSEGARCPIHRGMMNRGVRRGLRPESARPDVGDRRAHLGRSAPRQPLRPGAPNDATPEPTGERPAGGVRDGRDLLKRHIEGLAIQDVYINKAVRKTLAVLGKALQETFGQKD